MKPPEPRSQNLFLTGGAEGLGGGGYLVTVSSNKPSDGKGVKRTGKKKCFNPPPPYKH